jgi:hypothetical protein
MPSPVLLLVLLSLGLIGTAEHSTYSAAFDSSLMLRHCTGEDYATHIPWAGHPDFYFDEVHALNGDRLAISLHNVNQPDHYIGISSSPNKLGLVDCKGRPDDCSFVKEAGLSDARLVSFYHKRTGMYITALHTLSGACWENYRAPECDVGLVASPAADRATWTASYTEVSSAPASSASSAPASSASSKLHPPTSSSSYSVLPSTSTSSSSSSQIPADSVVIVDASRITHVIDPLLMGCHSDSGYGHQPYGFTSQLVYNAQHEFGAEADGKAAKYWKQVITTGSAGKTGVDKSTTFYKQNTHKITFSSGTGFVGVANRGMGSEGFSLSACNSYEGFLFVLSPNAGKLSVRLQNWITGDVLDESVLYFPGGSTWTRLDFGLYPRQGTSCEGIVPGSDPSIDCGSMGSQPGHVCVRCAGQVAVGLTSEGTVNLGYLFLQPGSWGRFQDLPVRLEAVEALTSMGITAIRQGGEYVTDASHYSSWKSLRGPVWQREPWVWGSTQVSGWGPFEMIDLCNAAGIEPIISFSARNSAQDMADLVEYCWGSTDTTQWGQARLADSHPAAYRIKFFAIGNEEKPSSWISIVAAMEAKAIELGLGGTFYYIYPDSFGVPDAQLAEAERLGLRDRIIADIHNAGSGGVNSAMAVFGRSGCTEGAANLETNGQSHTLARALMEAWDLNEFFNANLPKIKGRAASFCTERSGHFDNLDQGLSFYLPNGTWLQPPGYVHQMISTTWLGAGVSAMVEPGDYVSASAQVSGDWKTLIVRIVTSKPLSVKLDIAGFPASAAYAFMTQLTGSLTDANTPASPDKISPKTSELAFWNGDVISLPAAYSIITFHANSASLFLASPVALLLLLFLVLLL